MSAIDREQTLAAFGEWVEGRDEPDRWMIAVAAEIIRSLPAIPDQEFHCAACGAGVCPHYVETLNAVRALPLDEYGAAYDLANDLRSILSGALPALETPCGEWFQTSDDGDARCALARGHDGFHRAPVEPVPAPLRITKEWLDSLRLAHHKSDDCWYSCPKSGESCNDEEGDGCNCGADEHNARIDAILASAPVPAPRLEWEKVPWASVAGDWAVFDDAPHGWATALRDCDDYPETILAHRASEAAAKSLAEKLNDVLSPPVGPQE